MSVKVEKTGKVTPSKWVLPRVAQFEKVSYEQFKKDFSNFLTHGRVHYDNGEVVDRVTVEESYIKEIYDGIKLPTRATAGSSGYDLYLPMNISSPLWITTHIPMGIKCMIDDAWTMLVMPKSGLGLRFNTRLSNTVGNIDSDYYGSESNEGHIFVSLRIEDGTSIRFPDSQPSLPDSITFEAGRKLMQAVFVPYGITRDDKADGVRTGGHGSTGK